MCAVKQFVFGAILAFQILSFSNGNPLFLKHTFLTSLLGASSGSTQGFEENPYSENIANVRPNSEKLEQSYQENTGDNSFSFPAETNTPFDFDFTTTTSEAPSLLKKKVEKIIRKIVTISQIQQAVSGQLRNDNTGFQYPYSPDLDSKDIRISKEYGQPLKIDLTKNTNERKDNIEEKEDMEETKDEKIAPQTLGIFIFELFASLVGLTLGAAAQVNHTFAQNNTV